MTTSRTGRIHLIYQFIILIMLAVFIGCDDLFSERKYIYLSICIFFSIVLFLFCYNELPPVQTWIAHSSSEAAKNNEESCKNGSVTLEYSNNTTQKKKADRDPNPEALNKPSRVYRLRNWKKEGSTENKSIRRPSSIFDASSIVPMEDIREYSFGNCDSTESDLTKRYYFPFRQKRLEEWVDSKESRPYKIRPWDANHQESTKPAIDSSEVSSAKSPNQPRSSVSSQSPDIALPKSYSFPFRRKRLEHWMEIQENHNNLEATESLPQWQTMDYSEYDPEFRLRKSFSGSALNTEELDSEKFEKEKDFSQSVEIAYVSNAVDPNVPTSPTNAFNRFKSGFKDCFSKMRKESFKGNTAKRDNKRRAFKSFFQSKENVSLNIEKKSPKLSSNDEYKF